MDLDNMPKLKLKYIVFGLLLVFGALGIASYPILEIAKWLAEILSIQEGVPVKDQEHGWLWVFLFLSEAVVIFSACYTLLTILISKIMGWSKEMSFNIFWKGNYPAYWLKK
ncbi:MAG: hypothetical protein V3T17_19245 [Pseudomonadales bacterium]